MSPKNTVEEMEVDIRALVKDMTGKELVLYYVGAKCEHECPCDVKARFIRRERTLKKKRDPKKAYGIFTKMDGEIGGSWNEFTFFSIPEVGALCFFNHETKGGRLMNDSAGNYFK